MSGPGWSQSPGTLNALLRQAGASMHYEHGVTLPADFGSSAGELAVCLSAVGIGVLDEGDDGVLLAVVGPRAEALMEAADLHGLSSVVLREAPGYLLVTTPWEHAVAAWHALAVAGSALGAGHVGSTALHNFLVRNQLRARQMHA